MLGSVTIFHSTVVSSPFTVNSVRLDLGLSRLWRQICSFAYTLWLFTFSDLKTVFFPTALPAAHRTLAHFRDCRRPHVLHLANHPRVIWIWLHLLQFCLSNQCLSPEEDASNKPWRPIPSGRITVANARSLRWAMLAVCLSVSAHYGVLAPSVALALGTLAHNELGMDAAWLPRNMCNAVGYAAFNAGATYVAYAGGEHKAMAVAAQVLNALVIVSTIQAQDFQDTEGDRLTGRKTLPIVFPRSSRWAMPVLLAMWSAFLVAYWHAPVVHGAVLSAMGALGGARFVLYDNAAADRKSYRLYNLWLCAVHVTPFIAGR
ncbi:UbiA prenyltransferase family-domain-containing protein [Lenzites betulinus]|nr:UbiA prenyltransferase family-domain-containing protein [Lenzites betulinus]